MQKTKPDGMFEYSCDCCGRIIPPKEPHMSLEVVTLYAGRIGSRMICRDCIKQRLNLELPEHA